MYRSSTGTGGPNLRQLREYIDNLNRIYNVDNNTWIGFYMRCDIGYIDDDNHLNVGTDAEAWDLLQTHKERGCINIHIVNNVQDVLGISYRARFFGVDGIFLDARTYTDPDLASTIAHEVGHYFELDHTHQYYDKGQCRQEPVDRNRTWPFFNVCFRKTVGAKMCEATGDGLRDTPADPELNSNFSCTFNIAGNYTNRTDNWGDHYASPPTGSTIPDTRNIMSYNGARGCRDVFSRLQIAVMLHSIYSGKSINNRTEWMDAQGEYDEYEMDNFSQVARTITFNEIQERNFHQEYRGDEVWGQCDVDWVRFIPTCSGEFVVETSAMSGRANADTKLTLFNASLNQLAENDNISTSNLFSALSYNFVAGQEYLIRIENVGAFRGTSYYRLQVHINAISGADLFCGSSSYSIPGLPSGSTITWTASPSFVTPNPATGNPVTLSRINDGDFTLTAQVTFCGSTYSLSKQIRSGAPTLSSAGYVYNGSISPIQFYTGDPSSYNPLCNSQNTNTVMQINGASSVNWTKLSASPSTISWSQTDNDIYFYLWSINQTAVFRLQASNGCGSISYDFGFKSIDCSGGGGGGGCAKYAVTNKDKSNLRVVVPNIPPPCRLAKTNKDSSAKEDNIDWVKIYDMSGKLRLDQHFGNTKNATVNTFGLLSGVYIIEISDGKEIERQKVVIIK